MQSHLLKQHWLSGLALQLNASDACLVVWGQAGLQSSAPASGMLFPFFFFFFVSSARISLRECLMLFRTPLTWVGLFSKQSAQCISCGNLTAVTRKPVTCSCYCLVLVPIKCNWTSESRVDAVSGRAEEREEHFLGSVVTWLWALRCSLTCEEWREFLHSGGNHTCAQYTLGTRGGEGDWYFEYTRRWKRYYR